MLFKQNNSIIYNIMSKIINKLSDIYNYLSIVSNKLNTNNSHIIFISIIIVSLFKLFLIILSNPINFMFFYMTSLTLRYICNDWKSSRNKDCLSDKLIDIYIIYIIMTIINFIFTGKYRLISTIFSILLIFTLRTNPIRIQIIKFICIIVNIPSIQIVIYFITKFNDIYLDSINSFFVNIQKIHNRNYSYATIYDAVIAILTINNNNNKVHKQNDDLDDNNLDE